MKNQREDGTWDLDTKLDEDSHRQLRDLWDVTSLRRNATNLGVAPEIALNAERWTYEEYEQRVANAEREAAERADANPTPESPAPVPGGSSTPVPASVSGQQAGGQGLGVANPTPNEASGNESAGEPAVRAFADESLVEKPYNEWTNEQLRTEIAKRNEVRVGDPDYANETPMSTSGNKDELVARLKEDDVADEDVEE